jgi:hypothetical protein
MLGRCRTRIASAAPAANTTTSTGAPKAAAKTGKEIAASIEATDVYLVTRNARIQTAAVARLGRKASARATPPVVATIFPPRRSLRKSGRQCPAMAAIPAASPIVSPPAHRPISAAAAPFAVSRAATASPTLKPKVRQTLAAPVPPLPELRTSFPVSRRGSQ